MTRTDRPITFLLTEWEQGRLAELATAQDVSVAEIVRRALVEAGVLPPNPDRLPQGRPRKEE
jgi:hypothetical protein